jgi:aryl-alcohol dehydrogenase-like predicted oxidoreductase
MQLAGDGVFGPPRDREEALRVLRAAVAAGVDHIDTAQYYGAGTVNELIREALYPYPDALAMVSKVAARRDGDGALLRFGEANELRRGIEDNLATLGAGRLAATPVQVALAWLLDLAPNILLIPGTRTRVHLGENLGAADVRLDDAAHAELTRHFRIA